MCACVISSILQYSEDGTARDSKWREEEPFVLLLLHKLQSICQCREIQIGLDEKKDRGGGTKSGYIMRVVLAIVLT